MRRRDAGQMGDQGFMNRIELISAGGDQLLRNRVFEPAPLENRCLEQGGGCVGIVFQQFCRSGAVVGQIKAAIEGFVAVLPALLDQIPDVRWDRQAGEDAFVADSAVNQIEAERREFSAGVFQMILDLAQREAVIGAFVPIDLAVDHGELEAGLAGPCLKIGALLDGEPLHG